jgi:hypothetical protein
MRACALESVRNRLIGDPTKTHLKSKNVNAKNPINDRVFCVGYERHDALVAGVGFEPTTFGL